MKMTKTPLIVRAAALTLALLPGVLLAATTNIAQVPLLNITGTGSVKPNLMLLFDNSGSMEQSYTPDYINDNICRSKAVLAGGLMTCNVGHPPFMSPDFNRQYYNPRIRYQPPVKWDGTPYPEQNKANTSTWSNVVSDGFNKLNTDLYGASDTAINLVTGFPDLKWCTDSGATDCKVNSANYTYPDNTYRTAVKIDTAPYYWNILTAEYCRDDTMTKCVSTTAGAAAPTGYPVPATLRWCNSTALTNCQAKHVGAYIYPKYSTPLGAVVANGTIIINASATNASMQISQVQAKPPTGSAVTITNGAVTAPAGTDTALKQQTMASAVAASIIAVPAPSGGGDAYWACVKTPISAPTVSACSVYGVPVSADNAVVVLPIVCTGSTKNMSNCAFVNDDLNVNTRSGWGLQVTAPSVTPTPSSTRPATALWRVSGTTSNSGTPNIAGFKLGGVTIAPSTNFAKNVGASSINPVIVAAINGNAATKSHILAYIGGDPVTPLCASEPSTTICVVDTTATSNGAALTTGALSNMGSGGSAVSLGPVAAAAAPDAIPTVASALSNSASAPSAFQRVDIVSGKTYPKSINRVDCTTTAGVCTYDEEMTNFANWYSYYKTRLQMMKTSVGIAFAGITGNYRVGYARLSAAAAGSAMDMKPADFTGTNRTTWYTKLYDTTTSGSTPSRQALDNVGRMFANLTPYNYGAGQEVVQYPCQQNFMIFTTDGYWNGGSTANVVNNDNVENADRFCTLARGCVDKRDQTQPSLSDVALHWYNGGSSTDTVSLRPDLEPDMSVPGQVPAAAGDNSHLHVNTYTLGLGMDGVMTYDKNYDTAPTVGGDFYNIITQVKSGCPWNGGGAYVWPDPDVTNTGSTVQERVDDLWHAAVSGHGQYFSANQPKEVVEGLGAALANMAIRLGAAAAAATSTPNISQLDNDIFADTFTTVKWFGELSNQKIDPATGVVSETRTWVSSDTVGKKVAASTDSRSIFMDDGATGLKNFDYSAMSPLEKGWFDNKCSSLAQCTTLSAGDRVTANSGANLVNWLRGQQQYADDKIFRAYTMTENTPAGASGPIPIVLGDIVSSKPAYMREPRNLYTDPDYVAFKALYSTRPATVFTAANDGMLHAFNAVDGAERWAYVPRITMKKLYNLASTTYGTNHIFTTDGSPEIGDVQIAGKWRTVLVAGLNGGGRGFYALDVTTQDADGKPKMLWELCADAAICSKNDPDIGLTFGNPVFGTWQGKWVVFLTSGYNNVPGVDGVATGNGQGYLYIVDVANGTILKKVTTGSGSTATPSGLARIGAVSADPLTDPFVTQVYAGDILGQMWRFDMSDPKSTVVTVTKMGDAGVTQPITTAPDITTCAVKSSTGGPDDGQRVILFGTGRLLDVPDTTNTDVQSLYLIKDSKLFVNVRGTSNMVEQVLSSTGTSTRVFTVDGKPVDLKTKDGWFLDWKLLPKGERMNLDPQIVNGVANVVTNIPSASSSCSVGGTSNVYAFNVCNGSGIIDKRVGGTLSNTSATVGFLIVRLPRGELKMISTSASGKQTTTSAGELGGEEAHPASWRRVRGE